MNPVAIIGLTVAVIFGLTKARNVATIKALNILISKIKVSCSGFLCTQPLIQISLSIQNPTDSEILIKSLTGSVYLNGSYVGNISSFNNAPIAPNAATEYPVAISISAIEILQNAADLLDGKMGLNVKIRITGTVNADNMLIPVDITQNVF